MKKLYSAITLVSFLPIISHAQNIAVNTTGTAAAAANMFEVTQSSTTNNTVGILPIHCAPKYKLTALLLI